MPRAKGGYKTRRRRKKWLELTKGFRGSPNNVYRLARQAAERALAHAYRGRKQKKRDYRRLWIIRVNAALEMRGYHIIDLFIFYRENNIENKQKNASRAC